MTVTRSSDRTLDAGSWYTTADLDRLGVTPAQRRRLASPHRGVFGRQMPKNVLEDARAASLVLPPDTAFSHETAARLRRLPLPWRWDPEVRPPLHVLVPHNRRMRRTSIRDHRKGRHDVVVTQVKGLPVVSGPDVFMQLAPQLALVDLVALGDAVVAWRSGVEMAHLVSAVHDGLPGVAQARRALELVRPGSNSVTETRTRLVMLAGGLPEPQLNAAIVVDGVWLAYVDFYWPLYRLIVEYYGIHHFLTDSQRRDDIRRIRALREHGFHVLELTKEDLDRPAALVGRVRTAMNQQAVALGL